MPSLAARPVYHKGLAMSKANSKKRMTLSDHLALRAKAAEESQVRKEAHSRTIQNLKALDAITMCTCPACVRLRQARTESP